MALETSDDFLTVTGSQWVASIADIVSGWLNDIQRKPDISYLTMGDRGRCHAIILLLMVMLESYSQRAAVDTNDDDTMRTKQFDVASWWRLTGYDDKEKVLDALLLRNVLAHNHLYSYSLNEDAKASPVFTSVSHFNSAFMSRVKNGRLNHTGMNCVTEMIGPREVIEVSRVVREALSFLRRLSPRIGPIEFTFVRRTEFSNLWLGIELATKLVIERVDSKVADNLSSTGS